MIMTLSKLAMILSTILNQLPSEGPPPSSILVDGLADLLQAGKVLALGTIARFAFRSHRHSKLVAVAIVLVWGAMFAALAGEYAGTHREGHGEDSYVVRDFEPTPAQRWAYRTEAFFFTTIPMLIGAALGWRDRKRAGISE